MLIVTGASGLLGASLVSFATNLGLSVVGLCHYHTIKIAGVPMFGLRQDSSRYFDYHHTANDTFDKIDPEGLDRNVAAVAVFAYCAASSPEMLERIPPDKREEPRRRPGTPAPSAR